jgi:hypothetical protein
MCEQITHSIIYSPCPVNRKIIRSPSWLILVRFLPLFAISELCFSLHNGHFIFYLIIFLRGQYEISFGFIKIFTEFHFFSRRRLKWNLVFLLVLSQSVLITSIKFYWPYSMFVKLILTRVIYFSRSICILLHFSL